VSPDYIKVSAISATLSTTFVGVDASYRVMAMFLVVESHFKKAKVYLLPYRYPMLLVHGWSLILVSLKE